jgi:Na+-translocating ferredoxin:NAD+ oxidoreductase RnfG subunit
MELRDKRRNEQLARSGAGTASCGRSGDQIELVYGVDRDGTLWPTCWRPWAGRGSAHTAGMELRDKQRNEQLARSGAGTASCGRSGDQIELVYGVDRDGTLWPT